MHVQAAATRLSAATPQDSVVQPFSVDVAGDGRCHVVRVAGELDIATRALVEAACLDCEAEVVLLDVSGLTFMDCSGYRAIMSVRRVLETRGATFTVTEAIGQPARLLGFLRTDFAPVAPQPGPAEGVAHSGHAEER